MYISVYRVADYSIAVARNALTYNLPAKIALETVDVLKRYFFVTFRGPHSHILL